jgi:hypothetical protein
LAGHNVSIYYERTCDNQAALSPIVTPLGINVKPYGFGSNIQVDLLRRITWEAEIRPFDMIVPGVDVGAISCT